MPLDPTRLCACHGDPMIRTSQGTSLCNHKHLARRRLLCLGRFYCRRCDITREVVYHPDAVITCGRCDGPVIVAKDD